MKWYSPYQFAVARILLGVYVAAYLLTIVPYAPEIFSSEGMLPDPTMNFDYGWFPNLLYLFDGPVFVTWFLIGVGSLGLLFAVGFYRRVVGVLLWYGWACLFTRNDFAGQPAIPVIGWMILACSIPSVGEPLSVSHASKNQDWKMPGILYWGAWLVMGMGYSVSGLLKLVSPSWSDGTAAYYTLQTSAARNSIITHFVEGAPAPVISFLTYSVLALEVLFLPMCLNRYSRFVFFWGMTFVHVGLICMFIFPQLTAGMFILHFFTFDSRWFPAPKGSAVLYFDGVCGLCNRTVDFVLSEDQDHHFRFAALQGETAKAQLPKPDVEKLGSIVVEDGGTLYYRSDAVLRIVWRLGGMWAPLVIFKLIPRSLRDVLYRFVAHHRYRIFGQHQSCRIPSAEERSYFLD